MYIILVYVYNTCTLYLYMYMYMYTYMIIFSTCKWPFSSHSPSQMQFCPTLFLPTKVTTCWLNIVLCTCFCLTLSKAILSSAFCTKYTCTMYVYVF